MFVVRVLTILFLLCFPTPELYQIVPESGTLEDTKGSNEEKTGPGQEDSSELGDSSEETLVEETNFLLDNFIGQVERFWIKTRETLDEYKNKDMCPGQWILADIEKSYLNMRDEFMEGAAGPIPTPCIHLMEEYEARYNKIMWDEIEREVFGISKDDLLGESTEDALNAVIDQICNERNRMSQKLGCCRKLRKSKRSGRCSPLRRHDESDDYEGNLEGYCSPVTFAQVLEFKSKSEKRSSETAPFVDPKSQVTCFYNPLYNSTTNVLSALRSQDKTGCSNNKEG